jgi:hypothetical protein
MKEQPLRVPGYETPRFFNRDASTGFALGILATPTTRGLSGLAIPLAGALAGAIYGKQKLQREQVEGKLVHPPSYFNKDAIIGISDGLVIGTLIGIFTGGAALLAAGLGAGLGAYGSHHGHTRMTQEYEAAKDYVAIFGEYRSHDDCTHHSPDTPSITSPQARRGPSFTERLANEATTEPLRGL